MVLFSNSHFELFSQQQTLINAPELLFADSSHFKGAST